MKRLTILLLLLFCFSVNGQLQPIKGFYNEDTKIEYILQDYIQIPSVSGQEKEAGEFLKTICKNNGLHITSFGNENGRYNFSASIFPLSSGKPNIILLNHLDVVPESVSTDLPAYSGTIKDQSIYGRGAVDNKGTAMMQLYAICNFLRAPNLDDMKFNVTFLSVSCEESQCDGGAAYVVDNFFKELNPAVVFGEGPSELTSLLDGEYKHPIFGISRLHKKALWLKLELEYATLGHGSVTPNSYTNKDLLKALARVADKKRKTTFNEINLAFLKDLSKYYSGPKKMALKNPKLFKPFLVPRLRKYPEMFALFTNTVTVTDIFSDSDAVNQMSNKSGAYLDCRLLPDTSVKDMLRQLKNELKNDSIKITVMKITPNSKPSETDNVFYKNYVSAIQDKFPTAKPLNVMMPNVNDLGYFRKRGVPCYGSIPCYLSPDEVRSIHAVDEHIKVKSVYDGAEIYLHFLKRMSINP